MTTEFNFSVISDAKCRNVEPVTRMHRSGQELDDLGQNEAGKVPESQLPPAQALKPGSPLRYTKMRVPWGVSAGETTTHVVPSASILSHRRDHCL